MPIRSRRSLLMSAGAHGGEHERQSPNVGVTAYTSAVPTEDRAGLLAQVDTQTRIVALIALIVEASFLAAIAVLPSGQVLWALLIDSVLFGLTIAAVTLVELRSNPANPRDQVVPSGLTPSNPMLTKLVNGALHTVCRAVSVPETPESARLRAFIFRCDGGELVCTHYWAPNPVREHVGELRFALTSEMASRIAVVRAAIDRKITRTTVSPLPSTVEDHTGPVSDDLSFVIAAPIIAADGTVWGTVDFDAANDVGKQILASEVTDATMYQLSRLLQILVTNVPFGDGSERRAH